MFVCYICIVALLTWHLGHTATMDRLFSSAILFGVEACFRQIEYERGRWVMGKRKRKKGCMNIISIKRNSYLGGNKIIRAQ